MNNNITLVVEAFSETASFRIPEYHNYHKSLPLPPPTTLIGLVGAVMGLRQDFAWEFLRKNKIEIGITGVNKGYFIDLWKAISSKTNNRDTVLRKEYFYGNQYRFVFVGSRRIVLELKKYFLYPAYPTVIGSSDSLLKIDKTSIVEEPVLKKTASFSNCIIEGDYISFLRIATDGFKNGMSYSFTQNSAPQAHILPTGFHYDESGVRKIISRKEFTFVGYKVDSKVAIPTIVYKGQNIPIFSI